MSAAQLFGFGVPAAIALMLLIGCSKKSPSKPAYPPFTSWSHTHGKSMEPTIPEGSWIEVSLTPFDDLRNGDIVVYYHAGLRTFIDHRLDHKEYGHWVTKGDNNESGDPGLMTADVYVGRVVGHSSFPY